MQTLTIQPVGSDDADAVLEFRFFLVTAGQHEIELHRLPTLDAAGRIRLAVSVDDHPPRIFVERPTTDEYRGTWSQAIHDNIEKLMVAPPALGAGEHMIRLHAIDAYVGVSKIVVWTGPALVTSLGPEFSAHTDRPTGRVHDRDSARIDPTAAARGSDLRR